MRKVILFALVGIALSVASYGVYETQSRKQTMSDILLANIEALGDYNPETGTESGTTWQIGNKTLTKEVYHSNDPNWKWSVDLNIWLFKGQISHSSPSDSTKQIETVTFKCCRLKGDLNSCVYEEC